MTTPIERVRMLIERANKTTFEEEARTSALIAVKLIHEHDLHVSPVKVASVAASQAPKQELNHIPTGYYNVELVSSHYEQTGSLHAVRVEFMVESTGNWNSRVRGKTFFQTYVFSTPYEDVLMRFVWASGMDMFKSAVNRRAIEKFSKDSVGTKYGVLVEHRPWLREQTVIVNFVPYNRTGV
jgi:hypothetical protein